MPIDLRRAFFYLPLVAILALPAGAFNLQAQEIRDDPFADDPPADIRSSFPEFFQPTVDGIPAELDPLGELYGRIAPFDSPARPPYILARYDLKLGPPDDQRTALEKLRAQAQQRQLLLEALWSRLKKVPPKQNSPEADAKFKILRYAFGEGTLDEALTAARKAGDEHRFRLAKLLLAECRFDDAIRELAVLGEGKIDLDENASPPISQRALALLVRYRKQRAALEQVVPVLPTTFDLDAYFKRRTKDPAAAVLIKAMEVTFPEPSTIESEEVLELEDLEERVEAVIEEEGEEVCIASGYNECTLQDAGKKHLVVSGREFVLFRERGDWDAGKWIDGDRAKFTLFSIFNGPIRFRLYSFANRDEWNAVTAEKLAAMKPARIWTKTFAPLKENNRCSIEQCGEHVVEVENLEEGHYLLLADARYAPMAAACKFCVSDVALYIRAGSNRGVVVAVDRRTGKPAADLPLSLEINVKPDLAEVCKKENPADEEAFRAGFCGYSLSQRTHHSANSRSDSPQEGNESEADSGSLRGHIKVARAYAEGIEARRRYPDFTQRRDLRTGADGSVAFDLDLSRQGYDYTLDVRRQGNGPDAAALTSTQLYYKPTKPSPDTTKAVVWVDQPIRRPGGTVNFKGIVRRFNGLRIADHTPKDDRSVKVEVINREGPIWSGKCQLSDAGTFSGSFKIPRTAPLGYCRFTVDGENAGPSAALDVAEYRLPTYQVSLELPERTLAGGETLTGSAEVRYLTGKPADGAEVELVLETGQDNPPSVLAYTDKKGHAEFSMTLPQVEQRQGFVVIAIVADASGQTYTGYDRGYISADAFQVKAWPTERLDVTRRKIPVKIRAFTWQDRPIAGATVVVEGLRKSIATNESGIAKAEIAVDSRTPPEPIDVTVVADGKVVRQKCDLTDSPNDDPFGDYTSSGSYSHSHSSGSLGESLAGISIRSMTYQADAGSPLGLELAVYGDPKKTYTVALFSENTIMLGHRMLRLRPGTHTLSIETQADWAPSMQLTAVLLDGKRARIDREDCYLLPTEKFLTLDIETDRQQYNPGEKCVAAITARDHRGRPVPRAEISLGVVDEGIYILKGDPTPDLQMFFHRYHLPNLCFGRYDSPAPMCESLWYWLGPRYAWGFYSEANVLCGRHGLIRKYGGTLCCESAGRRGASRATRCNFQETAYWVANLVTDDDGRARTAFTLPDNMTDWRFTARGVTADTKVGEITLNRRSLLPLQVELALPRGFRAGDRIDLPVVLHNNTDKKRTVGGTTRTDDDKPKPWAEIALPGMASRAFTIPVAAEKVGQTTIFASVDDADSEQGDAIEKKLGALPRGYRFTQFDSGTLAEPVVIEPLPPGKITDHGLTITVRRETGLSGSVCSALDSLIQYPYGCVEQTMSRFMPAVVAGRAIEAAKLENTAAKRLPEVVDKGLDRLADYQHDDGGWGWWKNDETNDFMTAYVLRGLALCRDLDMPVPPRMIADAQKYLVEQLADGKLTGRRPHSVGQIDLRIYAAHALATAYRRDPQTHEQGIKEVLAALELAQDPPERLSTLDPILLADSYRMLGNNNRAKAILSSVADKVSPSRGNRESIVTAGELLYVGMAISPEDRRWPRLARKLVLARRGTGWGDTQTDSAAVRGLAALLAVGGKDENIPVDVLIDGRKIGALTETRNAVEVNLPAAKKIELKPHKPNGGNFYSVGIVGYLERPPKNPSKPAAKITARVFQLQPSRVELKPDASGLLHVARGKTLELTAEIELSKPISHARLTIPRPCGVELVVPPKRESGVVATEQRDSGFHFFIAQWEPGVHKVRLLVSPELSGQISTGLPELSPMYDDPLPTAIDSALRWVVEQ